MSRPRAGDGVAGSVPVGVSPGVRTEELVAALASGLCAQSDPEVFFPEKGQPGREARRVCAGCPVRAECLEWALRTDQRYGIWGGVSEATRRELRRARAAERALAWAERGAE